MPCLIFLKPPLSPSFKLLPLLRTVQLLEAKLDVGGVLLVSRELTYEMYELSTS